MRIRIGKLYFSSNEGQNELYVEREEEALGMAEIFPYEWESFENALRNGDFSYEEDE